MVARIIGLAANKGHRFSKRAQLSIRLIAGHGVEGDAHAGAYVKHRSRVAKDPGQVNLRQVHMIHAELFDELALKNFQVSSGDLGENVTTRGIDLLGLSAGTRLRLGCEAVIEITGLRNPCVQLDRFAPGLMTACLGRTSDGTLILKAGVMAIVLNGGDVHREDQIAVDWQPASHMPLGPV